MTDEHGDHTRLDRDELTIIGLFIARMNGARQSVLSVSDLFQAADPRARSRRQDAVQRLIDRGWLVTSAPLHWNETHVCILVGDGLRTAELLGGRPIPAHS